MRRGTPLRWRKAWNLYRSSTGTNSMGDPERRWNMETPDYIGEAGKASGICWQVRTGAWTAQELGERAQGGATFDLFTDVSISPFDRCVFGGSVWEVRAVLPRSDHRHVVLELVGAAQSSGQNTQNSFVPVYMHNSLFGAQEGDNSNEG